MPEDMTFRPNAEMMQDDEILLLVELFTRLGFDKFRLTGGEPTVRAHIVDIVRGIASTPGVRSLSMTTNGVLLGDQAAPLRDAGLKRVTVCLDTLVPDRFTALTRLTSHARVLDGITTAARLFGGVKIDTVVMRGINDDEMVALVEYARALGSEVRFIEYMDVGGATQWSPERVLPRDDILRRLAAHYGTIEPIEETAWAPADRFRLPDGTVFGIIASTTSPFCGTCDRARLTADGVWFTCLYAAGGLDLRKPLREGATAESIGARLADLWRGRTDRGAELRLAERERGVFVPAHTLKQNPHLEMHTKGG
jgi:cyclic pyranopterin phosphate synthase